MRRTLLTVAFFAFACGGNPPASVPAAPSGLTATGGNGQISLSWTGSTGATGYDVQRGSSSGQEQHLASVTTTSFTDTGLAAGATYFYVVKATSSAGSSAASNEASATTAAAGPTGLTATGGAGQVALTWTAVAGATYIVSRGTAAGGPYSAIASPTAASYTDTGLAAGTRYYYVVQAVAGGVDSANSAEANAITAPAAPSPTATSTDSSVTLQWPAVTGAASYDVLRGGTLLLNTSALTATETGLSANTAYSYVVRARNESGVSPDGAVSATTAPAAPTGLSATASNHHVALNWTAPASPGSGGYRVLRGSSASGPFTSAGTSATTSFTDTLLANGTQYFYVVHTVGGSGESSDSNVASATPFIEVCALDAASNNVSVFDGTATGNVAPKRSFGWQTGVAGAAGIGTDGSHIFIGSRFTRTVNVYPRTVSGNTAPSATIDVPDLVTALTVDATNSEIYVAAADGNIYVYPTSATGAATPSRKLTTGATVNGLGIDLTHGIDGELFVLKNNQILVYLRSDHDNATPQNTITPDAPVTSFSVLYGGAYDSIDDTIWVVWYRGSDGTQNISSYSRTASGTTAATKTVAETFSDDRPAGVWVQNGASGTNYVWFTTGTASQIFSYKHTSTTFGLFTLIKGSNTGLYQPDAMALDATNSEFWVVNGHAGAEAFTVVNTNGVVNVAPQRSLDGFATGIGDPLGLAVDRVKDELVERDLAPVASLNVYPRTASGAAAPSRVISGPTTNLDGNSGLAVDEVNGEYWAATGQPALMAFARAQNGDGAPARSITGDTNVSTVLGNPEALVYDAKAGQIVASSVSLSVAGGGDVLAWNRADDGDVPPDRDGTMDSANLALGSYSIDYVHDLIFSDLGTSVVAFPRAFASAPITLSYSITFPNHQLTVVDGEGNELYTFYGQGGAGTIGVYSSAQTSGTITPTRTISGSATKLYDVRSLIICN